MKGACRYRLERLAFANSPLPSWDRRICVGMIFGKRLPSLPWEDVGKVLLAVARMLMEATMADRNSEK